MASTSRYDQIANFYLAEVGDRIDDEGTVGLLQLVGEVTSLRVLDMACGQGRITRELARRGARVIGVDLSRELVDRARAAEQANPLGVGYLVADVAEAAALKPATFDGVVCNYGLSDIDDLEGALATVERSLRPDGFFAFSILHPCFPGWREDVSSSWRPGHGYFSEGWWRSDARSSRLRQRVGANHRTLSTYVNALTRHGLAIQHMLEPPPPESWLAAEPESDPLPTFLAVRCIRRALL